MIISNRDMNFYIPHFGLKFISVSVFSVSRFPWYQNREEVSSNLMMIIENRFNRC